MIPSYDEPVYQLRGMLSNWSYAVRLQDVIDRLAELAALTTAPNEKQALKVMLASLTSLKQANSDAEPGC